jgi:hypothetical protein
MNDLKIQSSEAAGSKTMQIAVLVALLGYSAVQAQPTSTKQPAASTPPALMTPNKLDTRIGTLEFKDGAPSVETANKAYDTLDFTHALSSYLNSYGGASAYALCKGFADVGAPSNSVVIFSELMDSNSLFLTPNADTIYYLACIDLTKGPMVIEQPPKGLGAINDMWFGWIIDAGFPGPDRGEGGKYLILPPGYTGPVPDGGFYVARSKTNRILYGLRAFLTDNNPKPTADLIKKTLKIYPYTPGGIGTSIATALEGKVRLGANAPVPATKFVEASGKSFNTIPPSDASFFDMLNENVQAEPADSYDRELAGQFAAIGIVKGKPFNPDARMRKIMTDAAGVGNATSRALNWRPRDSLGWAYYPGSSWFSMLWQGGAMFETPPPLFEEGMFKPLPSTGARTLDSKTAFYYAYTLDSPGMIMRIPRVGSQYLMGFLDADKKDLDGGQTYKVTLPPNIPAAAFWSFTLYDNQTRSMLQTPQRFPRAGSQTYPSPAAKPNSDGSTTVYFGPTQPKGVDRGNWIQTMPGKGYFSILRLYSPLEPFFTKAWRPSELELVK